MSLLASLSTDDSIANEKDSIGGSGPLDSGLYGFTITMAHINKAATGALGLVLSLKTADNKVVRQTLWMTSGTAKGCKNYSEKDGEKHYLTGFLHADAVALLSTGKNISALDTEVKVIALYSSDAKAEVPTKVDAVMELIGKEILLGIIKQTVDKTKKNEATGVYEATGETRDENAIDKVFRASDRMTTAEIRAQATEAVFANTWEQKWTGKTKDRAKGASGGLPGVPKLGGAPSVSKKPTTSLFS